MNPGKPWSQDPLAALGETRGKTVADYLAALRRRLWLVLLVALLVGGGGTLFTLFVQSKTYQGNAVVAGGTPIFRWQTGATANWTLGPWGVGVVGHYKSGYIDQVAPHQVSSYTTFDLYGTWQPTKAFALTLGARNVFDRDAPASNQAATFQVGYDPRFADPTGRAYYARGTYTF